MFYEKLKIPDLDYPLYKLFQNRLYNCHPCRQDRADCLLLIDTRDEMNRVIISSGNRQSLGIALIRLALIGIYRGNKLKTLGITKLLLEVVKSEY